MLGVQKACLAYAFHTVEAVDANIRHATRELREALCSARLMVGGNGAQLKGVPKVPKEAHLTARVTVEGKGVLFRGAQRVSMVAHLSA